MPLPARAVVREILADGLDQPTPDVVRRARARGVTGSDRSLREAVYEVRAQLRKPQPKPATAAAHATKPKPEPAARSVAAAADPAPVLANVALVNEVVTAAGGVEAARKVAEAVRACGGVDAFLLHLDTVAQVRGTSA